MPKVWLAPSGNVIRGHVLDCSVAGLTRALKDLDSTLYVKWNPKKLKKWGLWEVRRRPEYKSVKDIIEFNGATYAVVDYVENNFENHIIDVPFLNYSLIEKLKSMDTWAMSPRGRQYLDDMESRRASFVERENEKAMQERNYELRQRKTQIRELMDYTLSGGDPSRIAHYWDQKPGSQK